MAAILKFPNRPCPKCGKPIHIKSKSHDCGWKADGAAATSKASPARASSNGEQLSKMEAVRRILASSGDDIQPKDIQEQLKAKYKIKMDTSTISNYKSTITRASGRKKAGPSGRKMGRPAGARPAVKSSATTISLEDIRAVKELAERLGADRLLQLAEVLG